MTNNNWATVRYQLDQEMAAERTMRQARRRRTPLWKIVRQWFEK